MHQDTFEKNAAHYAEIAAVKSKQYYRLSVVRILLFVIVIIAIVFFANQGNGKAVGAVVIGFPFVFGVLVSRHNKVKYTRNQAQFLEQINREELLRISGDLKSLGSGTEYSKAEHQYEVDLDVLGRNSLYQLINRCTTLAGKETLAEWLLQGADANEVLSRQEAVKELTNKIDWRQNLQAAGMHFEESEHASAQLDAWLNDAAPVSANWIAKLRYFFSLAAVGVLVSVLFFDVSWVYLFIPVLVNGGLLSAVAQSAGKIAEQTNKSIHTLEASATLIRTLERTDFEQPYLHQLKSNFFTDNIGASQQISKLKKILDFLNARSNVFYAAINVLLLMDVHVLVSAEKWKQKYGRFVKHWFASLGKVEVISSMAAYSFANPEHAFPQISDQAYELSATGVGHPLIPQNERISNDYAMEGKGFVTIITGSNMSGKSTFLRTVGVNVVLAMMGAPVCAVAMKVSPMQVFTSMRTQDNLEEHVSSFYAELQRIKKLLDLVQTTTIPVLFMLDEILKGTNSVDRNIGAKALANQLHRYNGFGFISTHDLELGVVADNQDFMINFSFNSVIENNEIIFDYKLHPGVCNSFNASKLMEKMGIDLNSSI